MNNLLRSNLYPALLERRIVKKIQPFVYLGLFFWAVWFVQTVVAFNFIPPVIAFVK